MTFLKVKCRDCQYRCNVRNFRDIMRFFLTKWRPQCCGCYDNDRHIYISWYTESGLKEESFFLHSTLQGAVDWLADEWETGPWTDKYITWTSIDGMDDAIIYDEHGNCAHFTKDGSNECCMCGQDLKVV